jgi:hypothetical protein
LDREQGSDSIQVLQQRKQRKEETKVKLRLHMEIDEREEKLLSLHLSNSETDKLKAQQLVDKAATNVSEKNAVVLSSAEGTRLASIAESEEDWNKGVWSWFTSRKLAWILLKLRHSIVFVGGSTILWIANSPS